MELDINLSFIKSGDELQKFVNETDWIGSGGLYDLEKYQTELNNAIYFVDDESDRLNRSKSYFDKYEISYSYDDYVQKVFELTELKNKLFMARVDFNNAVYRKRESCNHEHDSKYIGHDHSYNYYMCNKCGYEIKE